MLFHEFVEPGASHARDLAGLADIAPGLVQQALDIFLFRLVQGPGAEFLEPG